MNFLKVGIIFLSASIITAHASAEGVSNALTGSARFKHEDAFAKDPIAGDRASFSSIRIRPNLQINANSDLALVLEPQFVKVFGAQTLLPTSTAANAATDTSGNTAYSNDAMTVFQAYLKIKFADNYNFLVGRQVLKYGDELVIGQSDGGIYGRSFDALKIRYTSENNFIDLFNAKIVENTQLNSRAGGDKDLYGFYASWNVSEMLTALDAYYFYLNDARDPLLALPVDAGRPAFLATYGARWVTTFDKLVWKFEFAQNSGAEGSAYVSTNENSNNNMLDTDLSYTLDENTKRKVSIELFRADMNWRELYPSIAKQLGRTDVLGRRNLTGVGFHFTTIYSGNLGLDLDLYSYQRTSSDKAVYGADSKTAIGTTGFSDSLDVGKEIDLIGKYMTNENLTWSISLSEFLPGQYIKDNQGSDSGRIGHYIFLTADAKF